jgi:hypothetical protein
LDCGNGEPLTWWVYTADPLPEGFTPDADGAAWEHYHASIQRRLWDIRFTQHNTTKEKWGSLHFNNRTAVQMFCNGKLIYEFGTTGTDSGLSFAMAKVQYLQTALTEHSYNFFEPEENNGRKIWWYGLPATIKVKGYTWEIGIIPDYTAGLDRAAWWAEYGKRSTNFKETNLEDKEMEAEEFEDAERSDYINWGDALSDGHIGWHRKTAKEEKDQDAYS